MICAASNNIRFIPKDRFKGRLPNRIFMNREPDWALSIVPQNHKVSMVEDGDRFLGPFRMQPTIDLVEWAKENLQGDFEIILWADFLEAYHRAANDMEYEDAWSVGFEYENDAIFFKLRWM